MPATCVSALDGHAILLWSVARVAIDGVSKVVCRLGAGHRRASLPGLTRQVPYNTADALLM